jgi:hypothetical protein
LLFSPGWFSITFDILNLFKFIIVLLVWHFYLLNKLLSLMANWYLTCLQYLILHHLTFRDALLCFLCNFLLRCIILRKLQVANLSFFSAVFSPFFLVVNVVWQLCWIEINSILGRAVLCLFVTFLILE